MATTSYNNIVKQCSGGAGKATDGRLEEGMATVLRGLKEVGYRFEQLSTNQTLADPAAAQRIAAKEECAKLVQQGRESVKHLYQQRFGAECAYRSSVDLDKASKPSVSRDPVNTTENGNATIVSSQKNASTQKGLFERMKDVVVSHISQPGAACTPGS